MMIHRTRDRSGSSEAAPAIAVLAMLIVVLATGGLTAHAQTLGPDATKFPRYGDTLARLRKDGFDGNPAYYQGLLKRIDRLSASQHPDLRPAQLRKYDCELIPQCAPRAVYLLRIWGGRGRLDVTSEINGELDGKRPYGLYRFIHDQHNGAYWQGFWDYFFADRVPNGALTPPELLPVVALDSPWREGVGHLQSYLKTIPRTARLVIVGYSLGGTTAVETAHALQRDGRMIDYLILYDPVGSGGYRGTTIRALHVPKNVVRLYNTWQTRGCMPHDYTYDGRFRLEDVRHTKAIQLQAPLAATVAGGPCSGPGEGSTDAHSQVTQPGPSRLSVEEAIRKAVTGELMPGLTNPINEQTKVDGNRVTFTSTEDGTAGVVRIAFLTTKDWWTAIKLFDRQGKEILIEREHGRGGYKVTNALALTYSVPPTLGKNAISLPVTRFATQITIEFWTAKLLGAHTRMETRRYDTTRFDGRTVKIFWYK